MFLSVAPLAKVTLTCVSCVKNQIDPKDHGTGLIFEAGGYTAPEHMKNEQPFYGYHRVALCTDCMGTIFSAAQLRYFIQQAFDITKKVG